MRQRTALFIFCAGLLAMPFALAEERPAAWQRVELAAANPSQLADLRSPIVPHETRVPTGEPLILAGERIRFDVTSGGRRAAWRRTDRPADAPKVISSGSLALPGSLTFPEIHGRRYPLYVRAAEDGAAVLVSSMRGLVLPLQKATGHLVDSDRDGVLGSAGDGYVAPESRTVGPWTGVCWTRRGGVEFEPVPGGGWRRAKLRLPQPTNADHTKAWCLLQWRRQQCGVLPVQYDRALEDAMQKHADYLQRNGEETHEENPRLPGYTPEGDRAGRSSILGFGDESMLSAMEMHLGTLYHRTRPLQPGLTHTAIVFRHGIFLLNVFERRGGPLKDALLVYPPHGMEHVRLRFHPEGENPMPIPGSRSQAISLGTAINVFSEPLRLAESLAVKPQLELLVGKRRKVVESHYHYPGAPPSPAVGASNRGNVARIPVRPLKARTRHEAHARITLPDGTVFDYRWWFKTARSAAR